MSSPIDCFFVEPLDQICRDHHILTPSRISIKFMMTSTILAPRWFVLSSTTLLLSLQHKLVRVLCYTFSSMLPSIVLLYLGILPPFMSRMSWEFHHLLIILGIMIRHTITILYWVARSLGVAHHSSIVGFPVRNNTGTKEWTDMARSITCIKNS